ncbi:MAG: helix-turn-helix transcriptional regulator [Phycisphaerae bacterium]|nr:helix-turn-helix transcriptional regulator [Phycisphaerae bacterium]
MDESGIKQAFGKAVRKFRDGLGVSQEELAELADLHRTYISDIERGDRNISLVNIVRLAQALKVTPGDLLGPLGSIRFTKRRNIR